MFSHIHLDLLDAFGRRTPTCFQRRSHVDPKPQASASCHFLQRRKRKQGVTELEAYPVSERDLLDQFVRYPEARPDEDAESRAPMDVEEALGYERGSNEYGVTSTGMKGQPDQQAVLAVGRGSFTSIKGLPSKHTVMKHVITQMRSCLDVYLGTDVSVETRLTQPVYDRS